MLILNLFTCGDRYGSMNFLIQKKNGFILIRYIMNIM